MAGGPPSPWHRCFVALAAAAFILGSVCTLYSTPLDIMSSALGSSDARGASDSDDGDMPVFDPSSHPRLTLHAPIPEHYIPTPTNNKRLIVVGDIHGMDAALAALLEKVHFDPTTDHLVATGDMVSKGPDSPGVITRLMALNASAARGNHEDSVIRAWRDPKAARDDDRKSLRVARGLSRAHLEWLARLPVILTAAPLPVYIVHAGLVPGVKLDKQDPWAVMHMRTIVYRHSELRRDDAVEDDEGEDHNDVLEDDNDEDDEASISDDGEVPEDFLTDHSAALPVDGRDGEKWSKAWNRYQKRLSKHRRHTVVYGHDAKTGYCEGKYTFGLDSGCVTGGHLTALILEGEKSSRGFKHTTKRVSCKDF